MNENLRALISIFILIFLSGISLFFGVIEVVGYLNYYKVIVFSWMTPLLVFIPVVIFFPLVWFVTLLFKGYDSAVGVIAPIFNLFKFVCVIVVVISISLSYWYVTTLNDKGYIRCNGVPVGWMPGMATKYVTNEALCLKKDP